MLGSEVERVMEAWRARILLQDADQMREMARRWLQIEAALEAQIAALADEVMALRDSGQAVSMAKITRLDRYRDLLAQARAETGKYAAWANDLISTNQERMLGLGVENSTATIMAAYRDAGRLGAFFNVLPVEAVEFAIGYAGDGTPLNRLLMRDFPETMAELTNELIRGTALGINPRQTARSMSEAMTGNLNRALTIARTEQLRAYREANRQAMLASNVVEGYIRRAALNPRTCLACLALDGTEYPTEAVMHVHPSDRCFHQPKIKGLEPVRALTGADWFGQQDAETQRSMLGPEYYEAWRSGQFEFRDLASVHVDRTWGPTVKVTPLNQLIH